MPMLARRGPRGPQDEAPRRRGRRRAAVAAVTAGAAMLAAGAGAGGISAASTSRSSGVVDITYWNMWSGKWTTLIDKLVGEFNAAHPSIHVTALSIPSSNGDQKLLSAIAAGDPPSVFTEWNPEIGAYAKQGAIQNLNQFETGASAGVKSFLTGKTAAWATYGGKLYGLPMSMNSFELYYNKSMMKQAGISSPPKSMQQLFVDQNKEWKYSGGKLTQFGFYPSANWDQLMPMFKCNSFVNGRYDLATNPGCVAEMNYIAQYSKYPSSDVNGLETAVGNASGGSVDAFVEGKAGFWVTGMWEIPEIVSQNPSLQYGVEPVPAPPGGQTGVTWINGNYNVIPKGAPHPQQAWQFMTWMSGYHNASWAAQALPQGGWIPPSQSIATQSAYAKYESQNPYFKGFVNIDYRAGDGITPVTPGEAEYESFMTTAQTEVLDKKMTPHQALVYVDSAANKALGG